MGKNWYVKVCLTVIAVPHGLLIIWFLWLAYLQITPIEYVHIMERSLDARDRFPG